MLIPGNLNPGTRNEFSWALPELLVWRWPQSGQTRCLCMPPVCRTPNACCMVECQTTHSVTDCVRRLQMPTGTSLTCQRSMDEHMCIGLDRQQIERWVDCEVSDN